MNQSGITKSTRRGVTTYTACNRVGRCYRFDTLKAARAFTKRNDTNA